MDPKTFRETFNQQVAERFDGDPRRLHRYGIHENDCDMGLLVRDGMRTLGKRLRPYLLSEWYRAHGKTASAELTEATFLIELIHNASLVIDDVQDLSPLRRGEPAFRMVHGDSLAINTGILMLFMAVRGAESLHPKIASLVSKHTLALIVGQGKDVLWERHRLLSTPLSEYERMCAHKTGALFALTVQIADELAA